MSNIYKQVDGHFDLIRDCNSKAILQVDDLEYQKSKLERRKAKEQIDRINKLEFELQQIKTVLGIKS